ncbi:MAG: hypothetical protein BM562_12090 [Alphaproteobacteria bacterium MedPE-SWcel]|nr:MAG: hypothetical protein BM562_12090 [Alphaproteobacteria bacterium MedPE-SWcel]
MKKSFLAAAFTLGVTLQPAQGQDLTAAQMHARLGTEAAQDQYSGYASLCDLEAHIRNVNVPRLRKPAGANQSERRPKNGNRPQRIDIPATQVFDNLWFLGTASVTAWLYGSEDGYVLIDGLTTDAEAQKYVIEGMQAAGLSPSAITAILVSHGHGDHYGGADYLAKTLGVDILMSQEDWDLVATLGEHPRFGPPPVDGGTVADGEILRFGSSEMSIHLTPGHTPGTISPIFKVYDGDRQHAAMLWGGTGFNFGPDVEIFQTYAASAQKMRRVAQDSGVDVFLSGHPRRDGTVERMSQLASRVDGTAHPFVRGEGGYALFDVLEHCALAQAERFLAQSAKQ